MTQIKVSEANIQKSVLDYLSKRGVMSWRNNSGAVKTEKYFFRFGAVGSPDIIAVVNGYFVGIEVKSKTGKWSDDQQEFARRLFAAGGIYLLVRSIDEAIFMIDDCISRVNLKGRPVYKNKK